MTKHFIFIGAPGSGKGTQAAQLIDKNGFGHISTGNLLREEVAKQTELGKRVDDVLKAGHLVSDDLVKDLLLANADLDTPLIFDGYPRTINQANVLSEILGNRQYLTVYFEVNVENLVERLTNRITCKGCAGIFSLKTLEVGVDEACPTCGEKALYQREDDAEVIVRERQRVYKDTISPVLDYYEKAHKLVKIDASKSIEDIYKDILGLI